MTDENNETKVFQRWLVDHLMPSEFSHLYLFKVDEDGDYVHDFVRHYWDAWEARAALAATPTVGILSREKSDQILSECGYEPATPAVSGEALKDSVHSAIARGWCSRANEHKEFDADLASSIFTEVWSEVAAAQPASPLRGMDLSENERHAVAHARYQVDHATPENPDCCFDYELVATLLSLIASPPEQAAPVTEDELTKIMNEAWPDRHRAVAKKIIERLSVREISE